MNYETSKEAEEDLALQMAIRSSARASRAIVEKAFLRNGSGRYFPLQTDSIDLRRPLVDFNDYGTDGKETNNY